MEKMGGEKKRKEEEKRFVTVSVLNSQR